MTIQYAITAFTGLPITKNVSREKYPWAKMQAPRVGSDGVNMVYDSFPIPVGINRKKIQPTIASVNRRSRTEVRGEPDGSTNKRSKKPNKGKVIERKILAEFKLYDVDPATDPDKATLRIFRIQ